MDFDALYARYADSCDGWEYERGIRSVSTDDLSARLTDWLEGLVEDGESLDDQDDVMGFTPDEVKFIFDALDR